MTSFNVTTPRPVVLVAGAGSRLGAAVAARLLDDGALVHTVSERESATAAVAAAEPLDVLVNIASLASFEQLPDLGWRRDVGLDVSAMDELSRAALGPLSDTGGTLINVISASPWEFEDVRAEEAAMARVAEALARDARDEVRVHALHSGLVVPVEHGRPGPFTTAQRVAEAVSRLALPARAMAHA